ncbi:hypothetical protein BSAF29S_01843 [Bacillus safensis subsp. safensis]
METNIEFLGANKIWLNIYRIAVIGMVLFGAVATVPLVWGLADLFMGLMVIVNLIAITMLSKGRLRSTEGLHETEKKAKILFSIKMPFQTMRKLNAGTTNLLH